MTTRHIEHQIIADANGQPQFAVVPYHTFTDLLDHAGADDGVTIPHEIVKAHMLEGQTLLKAWRDYLGLTQKDVAKAINATQAGYSQLENSTGKFQKKTRDKLAAALGIKPAQLEMD